MESKYAPLGRGLKKMGKEFVPITFSEIEKILHFQLPPTARNKREWWSNSPSGHSQAPAWLDAGYKTEKVDLDGEKLVFRRMAKPGVRNVDTNTGNNGTNGDTPVKPRRHPVFGCMAGTVTIANDVDLTEPATPEWAEMIEKKYGKDGPDFT